MAKSQTVKQYSYIYILTNEWHTTFYIGVTSNIIKRISEHKHDLVEGFSKTYKLHRLVYYEQFEDIKEAIAREKQLKGSSRKNKIALIRRNNPDYKDLYDTLM